MERHIALGGKAPLLGAMAMAIDTSLEILEQKEVVEMELKLLRSDGSDDSL